MNDSAEPQDAKLNLTRLGILLGVVAAIVTLVGTWFILPYRMDAAERTQANYESRTERRFETTEAEQRTMREILIRIDENVKQMKDQRPR